MNLVHSKGGRAGGSHPSPLNHAGASHPWHWMDWKTTDGYLKTAACGFNRRIIGNALIKMAEMGTLACDQEVRFKAKDSLGPAEPASSIQLFGETQQNFLLSVI